MGPGDSDKLRRDENELVNADDEFEEEEAYDDIFAPPVVNSEMADAADTVRDARSEEQTPEVEPELAYSDRRLYAGSIPPPPAPRHSRYMATGGDTEDEPTDPPPPTDEDEDEVQLPGAHTWSAIGAAPAPAASAATETEASAWIVPDDD